MKHKQLFIILACAALCGCSTLTKLPPITASQIDYKRTDPFGGTTIHAEGIDVDGTTKTVKAKVITWTTMYPQFSLVVSARDYVQEPAK